MTTPSSLPPGGLLSQEGKDLRGGRHRRIRGNAVFSSTYGPSAVNRTGSALAQSRSVHVSLLASVAATPADTTDRNPGVLPEFVQQCSRVLPANDIGQRSNPWDDIELPAALREATAKRQLHFRAGRYCALRALDALEGHRVPTVPPRAAGGAPIWPAGITGSITHTDDYVWAAVARTSQAEALGIDTERIMSAERGARVSPAIAWPSELAHARAVGCDRLEALTLVFSAKEAIFKCLYGKVGRVFDYRDVRIVKVAADGTFTSRIWRTLSKEFPAQTLLHGRFEINGPWVHTGMVLSSVFPEGRWAD